MLYPSLKRLFDIFFASLGLVLLLPCLVLVVLIMKLTNPGPVFYRQVRIGRFGHPFRIWKFRTMVVGAESLGPLVTQSNDARMTPVGRILRRTKFDELPQLWNVLVGEMSFVGPRPQVPRYIERLTPAQREMLQHRPGITDMASVQFRNEQELLSGAADVDDFYIRYCLPKKIALNLQYSRQASLPYDIWIIFETLCPYWVGVLGLYAVLLASSFWVSYELRYDFNVPDAERANRWIYLPWIVVPQLVLLLWRKQCRGLVSYFSFIELLQTGIALGIAVFVHLALKYVSAEDFAPSSGIIWTHFVVSVWGITWTRLFLKSMRESQTSKMQIAKPNARRVAIVGAGELGTKVALDLISKDSPLDVVAFFDDDPRSWNRRPYDIPVVGMPECLLNAEWRSKVDQVIVALPAENQVRLKEVCDLLKRCCLPVAFASDWQTLDSTAVA